MPIIRSERWAGACVYLGDGLVQFGADGLALGVVARDGRPVNPPAPIGRSQVESALQSDSYVVEGDENPEPEYEAGPDAEADAVPEAQPAEEHAERPDLAAMSRGEKYRYCRDVLGLEVPYIGTSQDDFDEAIRAAWAEADGK